MMLLFLFKVNFAQVKSDDILGKWMTEKKEAVVQIFKTNDNKYAGKIIWLEKPLENGKPVVDKKNPKPELRSRPIMGLVFVAGFEFQDGEWVNGIVYDAQTGNTYKAKIMLKDKNTLELRGYIGSPIFGRSTIWTRRNDK
ncbi:MAG: DUF2147 domain-containing protein [Bacteroidales bacterium]|nr:DUF2147 domain-containing protein [Bacteroidales bacterium]